MSPRKSESKRGPPSGGVRRGAFTEAFGDPRLFVPFVVAGVFAVAFDAARFADPVPVDPTTFPEQGVHLTLTPVPGLWTVAGLPPGALLGLRPPFVLLVVVVYGLSLAVGSVATGAVLARVLDSPEMRRPVRLARLAGYTTLVSATLTLVVASGAFDGFVGIVAFVTALTVTARLFVAPVYVLGGAPVDEAVRRSVTVTRGHGLSIAVFVLGVGLLGYALVSVDTVGPILATSLAGTVHAVGVARYYRRLTDAYRHTGSDASSGAADA